MSQPTKVVRSHDFRRTDLLERVDLQAIQGLLEAFARSATQKFTSTLRQPCSFEVNGLDQVTWRDLATELEVGAYFFTFSLPPLAGRAVLAIPTEEALALVDLRLAGSGEDDFSNREPSEIDKAFFAPMVEDFIAELSRALARIQTTYPLLEAQEGNIQFVTVVSPSEMCMAVRLSLTVASRSTREVVICLPFAMVRMLVDGLQARAAPGDDDREDAAAHANRSRLLEVPLDVVFQFPSFVTTPAQLLTLRVGDSLGLGHPKGRPLEVRAEGLLVALADMCSSGVHKACRIEQEVTR
ncbi:MAG TPA: flagellar motor switch protein FliM [Acidimicrobiales bacterium]|nr:flagellar motor switch protein FliM [Acidimicrobiales bacterium]